GCDYSCSWCDSAFTWDGSGKDRIKQMTSEDIWEELKAVGDDRFSFVTISGGNPALLKNLNELIQLLKENKIKVGLETQGSRWQEWFYEIDDLTLSPKPPSSKMETNVDVLDEIIGKLANGQSGQRFSLKIVIFDDSDFQYAKKMHQRYPQVPFY